MAAAAVALALVGGALARGAGSATGLLLVTYTSPSSLQVTLGDGTPVHSGSVVPAGDYNVQVKDDPNSGDQSPAFMVSGPGVNVVSDLNSTGMGIDGLSVFGPITLQTSSSYRIGDSSLPSSIVTFTTSSTQSAGSSTSGSSGTVVTTPSSSATTTSTPATSGSQFAGTLRATVSASGKVTLAMAGTPVRLVKAGRYHLAVSDRSRTAGLVLGHGTQTVLSLRRAVARGQHTVVLTAGRWFLAASARGPKTAFSVVS